ncbi:MAG: hypothetical protein KAY22_11190 [Rhizorhabdus sp.]|nr:hypothetical protein [Rhizorhabdus sp.]
MVMKALSFIVAAALAVSTAAPLAAAPCRDAKGKFIKCPEKAPAKKQVCKDAKGKFAKCGTPGAKPA